MSSKSTPKEVPVVISTNPIPNPVIEVVAVEAPKESVTKGSINFSKVPSDWAILPDNEGIVATDRSSGYVFTGAMSDFNKLLRG